MINHSQDIISAKTFLWLKIGQRWQKLLLMLNRPLLAFKKDRSAPHKQLDLETRLKDKTSTFGGIRCPLCHWQPTASSRWYCASNNHPEGFSNGCGTVWNTFTTQGLCPGCGHLWRWTTCLRCYRWSLHKDWYYKVK